MSAGSEGRSLSNDSTAAGSVLKLIILWTLMIRFRGLGYNTKRIHSIRISGKYLLKTLPATFSEPSRPPTIAVASADVLVIFVFTGTAQKTLARGRQNRRNHNIEPLEYLSPTSSYLFHSLSSVKSLRRGQGDELFRGARLRPPLPQFRSQTGIVPLSAFERCLSYQARLIRTLALAWFDAHPDKGQGVARGSLS